jgi:hypothetical protein
MMLCPQLALARAQRQTIMMTSTPALQGQCVRVGIPVICNDHAGREGYMAVLLPLSKPAVQEN